jgi:hypothetical protein
MRKGSLFDCWASSEVYGQASGWSGVTAATTLTSLRFTRKPIEPSPNGGAILIGFESPFAVGCRGGGFSFPYSTGGVSPAGRALQRLLGRE